MGRAFLTLVGAFAGFWAGAIAGTLLGIIWVSIFPSPDLPKNPQAGMGITFGMGLIGEAIGTIAGAILGWRYGTAKSAGKPQ